MVDFLLDDVKELLFKEKGDQKILERIKRAAERDEVISVYERDYVRGLAEKYLRPKPEESKVKNETKSETVQKPLPKEKLETFQATKKPLFESKSNPKTTKIAFGIGGIALAIILILGVSLSGIDFSSNASDASTSPTDTKSKVQRSSSGYEIETDTLSYELGDIISISGVSDPELNEVELSIQNSDGKTIWSENISIKSNGEFSTLVIAGGPGWEKSGEFELISIHGSEEIKMTFNFKN